MDVDGVVYIDDKFIRFRDLWDEKMGNMDGGCNLCGKMDKGYWRCPVCGRRVMPRNYLLKFKRMEEKYGTRNLFELSNEKLTFEEVATIYTFVEISDRHCGDNSTYQRCRKDGTYKNLIKRQHEITDEFYFENCSKHVMI